MTNPTLDRIVAEHKVIAAMMDAMSSEIDALETQGSFDIDLVRLILRYMGEYPDRFHHPKEELLFDIASTADAGFVGIAAGIRAEHGDLPAATDAIVRILEAVELGASQPRAEVLEALRGYVAREREHMQVERDAVFPSLERLLTADQWARADVLMDGVDDPLHGGKDPGPFKRLQDVILPAAA